MSDFEIKFGDLPKKGGGRTSTVWVDRLSPLLDHEGRWAHVWTGPYHSMTQAAQNLKNGKYKAPEGVWEFAVRQSDNSNDDKRLGDLWAKYVGDVDDTEIVSHEDE